jgi:seryl-tRNA synthetase
VKGFMSSALCEFRTSVIEPMMATNQKLMDTLKEQEAVIHKQSKLINEQETLIKDQGMATENLKEDARAKSTAIEALKRQKNRMQRYSRRNNIRLFNLTVPETKVSESDKIDFVVNFINVVKCKSTLPVDETVNVEDETTVTDDADDHEINDDVTSDVENSSSVSVSAIGARKRVSNVFHLNLYM